MEFIAKVDMNKLILYLIILFLVFFIVSCSKEGDNPLTSEISNKDIFDIPYSDSFEENGAGSIRGWSYCDSSYNRYISFSTDVPINGGNYSLCINNDSISGTYLFRVFRTQSAVYPKTLIIDFWAKGEGGSSLTFEFALYGSTSGFGLLMDTDSQWRHIIDTLHNSQNPYTPKFDSLKVLIGSINRYIKWHQIYLDNVQLSEITTQ